MKRKSVCCIILSFVLSALSALSMVECHLLRNDKGYSQPNVFLFLPGFRKCLFILQICKLMLLMLFIYLKINKEYTYSCDQVQLNKWKNIQNFMKVELMSFELLVLFCSPAQKNNHIFCIKHHFSLGTMLNMPNTDLFPVPAMESF